MSPIRLAATDQFMADECELVQDGPTLEAISLVACERASSIRF